MAITKHVQHPKSSATTATTEGRTVPRLPSSGDLLYGEIAVNYRGGFETLSIKNSDGYIVAFPTNCQPINATKPEGLAHGQIGIDNNDVESFYIYNDVHSRWQPVSSNYVSSESNLEGIPTVEDPQFAYVSDTGLLYGSQYDSSTSSQTWVPMATLVPSTKKLAHGQETKVVIDGFVGQTAIAANSLMFEPVNNQLTQYGPIPQGGTLPTALETYTPSKDVIYYNLGDNTAYRWNGTAMIEVLQPPTISTDDTMVTATSNNTITISSNVISADPTAGVIVYTKTPSGMENSASTSYYSIVSGMKNSIKGSSAATTIGFSNTIASGCDCSFVEGASNVVSGAVAHAEGSATTAVGDVSHSEGYKTVASGTGSHAEGASANTSGSYSHAEGSATTAFGSCSHAEGRETASSGLGSHSEGYGTYAAANYSHAEGNTTTSEGNYSHAEGNSTTAHSLYSHAEGSNTVASGTGSHSEGSFARANGQYSHAEGANTRANGNYSHAEGSATTASSSYSHAGGVSTSAIGVASFTTGSGTVANNDAEFACGKYNVSNTGKIQTIFSVGHGSSNNTRVNALEVCSDGKIYIYNGGFGTRYCLQDLLRI